LRPLPDHVVAPLLRALVCIPRTTDTLSVAPVGSVQPRLVVGEHSIINESCCV
jgi:hypothetical protein